MSLEDNLGNLKLTAEDCWNDRFLVDSYSRLIKDNSFQCTNDNNHTDVRRIKISKSKKKAIAESQQPDNVEEQYHNILSRSKSKKKTTNWCVGDACIAAFSGDGQWKEAHIVQIDKRGETCILRFPEYNVEEEKELFELLPIQDFVNESGCPQPYSVPSKHSTTHQLQHCPRDDRGQQNNQFYPYMETRRSDEGRGGIRISIPSRSRVSSTGVQATSPYPDHPRQDDHRYRNDYPDNTGDDHECCREPVGMRKSVLKTSHNANPNNGSEALMPPLSASLPSSKALKGIIKDPEALHAMLMSWYMCGYHTGYYEGRTKSSKK